MPFVGAGWVGGITVRGAQDDAAARGQRVRGGTGARERFELRAVFDGPFDGGSPRVGHDGSPAAQTLVKSVESVTTNWRDDWLRIGETGE
jgi:hypothetical protein